MPDNISFGTRQTGGEGTSYPVLFNGMQIGHYYPEPDGYLVVHASDLEPALRNAIQRQFGMNAKFDLFEVL